jgi:hypothetical protein
LQSVSRRRVRCDLRTWPFWSPFENDLDLKRELSGADSGAGAVYEWKGDSAEGRAEIIGARFFPADEEDYEIVASSRHITKAFSESASEIDVAITLAAPANMSTTVEFRLHREVFCSRYHNPDTTTIYMKASGFDTLPDGTGRTNSGDALGNVVETGLTNLVAHLERSSV